jgi:hypothetical protein
MRAPSGPASAPRTVRVAVTQEEVAGPLFDESGLPIANLDLACAWEERTTLDVTGHSHRPELLALHLSLTDTRRTTFPATRD